MVANSAPPDIRKKAHMALRLAACAIAASASSAVLAQSAGSGDAVSRVMDEVSITKTRDLDFGSVVVPRNGRIDMTAEGAATCTPNNGLQHSGACQPATFTGKAIAGSQIRISVPVNRRITLPGPGQDLRLRLMTVGAGDGLTFDGRVNRNFDFTVTGADGDFEFFVAGRLLFRNNQAPGVYSGTFDIEIDYQ